MNLADLLRENGIDYVTSGPNVRAGHVNVRCPWCGAADPSHHMGINPVTGVWGCWRNAEHSGRDVAFLLAKLLHCTAAAVRAMMSDTSDLRTKVERMMAPKESAPQHEDESLAESEPGVMPISASGLHERFWHYMKGRGYKLHEIKAMCYHYDLCCALTGRFRNRLIFPIRNMTDQLLGYTGRAIDGGTLRYLSYPGPVVKRHLLWENMLHRGGRRLWITEGPFDALRLDSHFHFSDSLDRATCTFGVNPSRVQLDKINELAPLYDSVVILFDAEALGPALHLQQSLLVGPSRIAALPAGVHDPAELSPGQIDALNA